MSTQEEKDKDPYVRRRVLTTVPVTYDWIYNDRKWGVNGQVIDLSNSHGLCYKVKHDDGSCSWYDPRELEIIG